MSASYSITPSNIGHVLGFQFARLTVRFWHYVLHSIRPVKKLLMFPVAKIQSRGWVLITGCDSGFGRMLAISLDRRGVPVIASCLTQTGCDSLQKQCSTRIKPIRLDVTKDASIDTMRTFVQTLCTESGLPLWAIVNNAGIFEDKPLDTTTIDVFQKTFDVNFFGTVRVTLALLPLIKASGGRIVNVTSAAGFFACPAYYAYAPSKFACEAFSDCLRRELRRYLVKVSAIEPGFMNTPMPFGKTCPISGALPESEVDATIPRDPRMVFAEDPQLVIDDLEHAILSRFPYIRYRSGFIASLMFAYATFVPTFLRDWLESWVF